MVFFLDQKIEINSKSAAAGALIGQEQYSSPTNMPHLTNQSSCCCPVQTALIYLTFSVCVCVSEVKPCERTDPDEATADVSTQQTADNQHVIRP